MPWTRTWASRSSPAACLTVCCCRLFIYALTFSVILGELIAKRTPAVLAAEPTVEDKPAVEDAPAQQADLSAVPAEVSEPAAAPESNGADAEQSQPQPDVPSDTPTEDPTDAPAETPADAPVEAGAEESTDAAAEQPAE